MIGVPHGVTAYAFDEPCYMRKSFDTLAALVTERMGRQVLTGDLFLFVGRDRRRAKVLYFDGTDMCGHRAVICVVGSSSSYHVAALPCRRQYPPSVMRQAPRSRLPQGTNAQHPPLQPLAAR